MPSGNRNLRIIGAEESGVRHMTRSRWEIHKAIGVDGAKNEECKLCLQLACLEFEGLDQFQEGAKKSFPPPP
jgi:hypothetical protein